jgi:hypothetical protein
MGACLAAPVVPGLRSSGYCGGLAAWLSLREPVQHGPIALRAGTVVLRLGAPSGLPGAPTPSFILILFGV